QFDFLGHWRSEARRRFIALWEAERHPGDGHHKGAVIFFPCPGGLRPMRKFRCALLIVGIDAMRRFTHRATAAILTPSQLPPAADIALKSAMAAVCRYCCKSLFALLIKNSLVGFRVKMRGTSYYDDKLVSDLAKATEATKISARQ